MSIRAYYTIGIYINNGIQRPGPGRAALASPPRYSFGGFAWASSFLRLMNFLASSSPEPAI